ncbi:uncharacterized protein LOC100117963 isoform X2 [Nasonia vitripennis]|uniref:Uncharacterized protein n=1 Tax=Nasonia vitripennis TaxID=7425 RepID=A0A7M7G318_NASVI|nr:uncharacterized protein LOC100117963 isoform X2 [Nasonia vitripennis]
MADAAAKRELRRRRILENSESRLQRITGRVKERTTEEKSNNGIADSRPRTDNGFANTNNSFIKESEVILEQKHKDFLKRDNSSDLHDLELTESDVLYQQPDNHFTPNHLNLQYNLKEDKEDYELNLKSKTTAADRATLEQCQYSLFYKLFFSPFASIFLAVFVNILSLANVDFTLYKGILTPYFIMATTRLCLGKKSEESQGSSMLMAALILCNIKPEIVRILKKMIAFYSTAVKDFAVYLTSFVLINWIISIFRPDLSYLQFF